MFPPIRLVEFWWRSLAPGRRETIVEWSIFSGKSRRPKGGTGSTTITITDHSLFGDQLLPSQSVDRKILQPSE